LSDGYIYIYIYTYMIYTCTNNININEQSLAKMSLSNVATEKHVEEAVQLFKESTEDAASKGLMMEVCMCACMCVSVCMCMYMFTCI